MLYAKTQPEEDIGGYPYYGPRIITRDEYDRVWKPAGWRLIIIGPTSTWRQEWGAWESIRDIVQNALDESEGYQYGYDKDGLWIADRGKGIAVADFLLGPPKIKPDYARGKFGEGMKIAALALIRKGYPVHIETAGRELWIVFLEQETNGKVQTLAALWRPDGAGAGTRFHIIGYNGTSYERYFAVNLPLRIILAETPSPIYQPLVRYNQLIRAEGMASSDTGGVIYTRDIYLQDIRSSFSYNLWGFSLAPDRHGPQNESEMWVDMGRLWCGVSNVYLLEEFLSMVLDPPQVETDETRKISMDGFSMGMEPVNHGLYSDLVEKHADAWRAAWRRVAGADAVMRTTARWDGMVKHLGYMPVAVQWSVKDTLSRVIMCDRDLVSESQERLSEAEVVPDDRLTPKALAHLNLARKIASYYQVDRVNAAVIPPASERARTAGLYQYTTETILLHLETLESAMKTLDAIIHELGHHRAYKYSGDITRAEDLTPLHSEKMTEVAAYVVSATAARQFDEEFKGVEW